MIRKIIQIDESKCNGCGACAHACHEGAIGMVDGIARLLKDDYCDGLGDCLPACPMAPQQHLRQLRALCPCGRGCGSGGAGLPGSDRGP